MRVAFGSRRPTRLHRGGPGVDVADVLLRYLCGVEQRCVLRSMAEHIVDAPAQVDVDDGYADIFA